MSDEHPGEARRLMQSQNRAALATSMAGAPYVSLVLTAPDADGAPLLLLSNLAQHTRNILSDPRVSLLFDTTQNLAEPLAGARLTLIGSAVRHDRMAALERYVERHPSSAGYAGFTDFHLYRVTVERGHFVAGFGKIAWIPAEALLQGR